VSTSESTRDAIRQSFADAGVRGWLHARPVRRIGHDVEVAVDADDVVPLASVYKLPLLVAFAQAVDQGALDPRQRTTLRPAGRIGGSAGITIMRDPVTISWRDLAASMISISDNAAADALYRKIGDTRIAAAMNALGLSNTVVRGTATDELRALLKTTRAKDTAAALRALANNDHPMQPRYSALLRSFSTPREITALLSAIWTGEAASAQQCAFARDLLACRTGPLRLRNGFPFDSVKLADKTGTFGALRHDVGVVEYPGETPWAVAVLTEAARSDQILPEVDAVIGTTARTAIDELRGRLRRLNERTRTPT
jgi:beta-lactamase class A